MKVDVTIDIQDVFDSLTKTEQGLFIHDNLSCASETAIINYVADKCDIDDVMDAFPDYIVESWIRSNAKYYDVDINEED